MIKVIILLIICPFFIYLGQEMFWRGGRGKDYVKKKGIKKFKWTYKSIVRDAGCALLVGVYCVILTGFEPLALGMSALCLAASWGAFSTYWKKLNRLLGVKDVKKDYWWNWLFTGLCYGLACLPLAFAGCGIVWIIARSLILACLVCGFGLMHNDSTNEKKVQTSERLIGGSIMATMPILLIGGL